jgi:hypothetical protein
VSDDTVERTQSATRIFRQIQTLARSDYGGNTNALLVVYAVEGFLRRLAASQYADKMTLKGGMLHSIACSRPDITSFRNCGCFGRLAGYSSETEMGHLSRSSYSSSLRPGEP